jgi:6-phosphofructokinase 1
MASLKAFVSHSSRDSEYVLQVCAYLKRHMEVFAYEEHQRAGAFQRQIDGTLDAADAVLVFISQHAEQSEFVKEEVETARAWKNDKTKLHLQIVPIILDDSQGAMLKSLASLMRVDVHKNKLSPAACAMAIVGDLRARDGSRLVWNATDDLPTNPHLFSYEKDILRYFATVLQQHDHLYTPGESEEQERLRQECRDKIADGCPVQWPEVESLASSRDELLYENKLCNESGRAMVSAAALDTYEPYSKIMALPEARPSSMLLYPVNHGVLKVAIAVVGGIAPGINAVIDGIVQRHWNYMQKHGHRLTIYGYQNGLHAVVHAQQAYRLVPDELHLHHPLWGPTLATSEFANRGGSILGTSRLEDLLPDSEWANETQRLDKLTTIVQRLEDQEIDILYLIGGDGTMRAAHALGRIAAARRPGQARLPLSVVAIPKTMDNDILWVWQSFGFMSAVEKSREFIQHLHTEVQSNPRLCVLQLFGSDSGFVVSHAVLASASGHCDVALIPEVRFSLLGLASCVETAIKRREQHVPSGMVVMAETAIPVDVRWCLTQDALPDALTAASRQDVEAVRSALKLDDRERDAILKFDELRTHGRRIQGQTDDVLRQAGLKLVMQGLEAILRSRGTYMNVSFKELRMLRNEPRHLVRAIPPSTSDIIMGQRLGTLAVDNAMAGYTDFMISQWLTEYVLVPLKLVVLGRKRIPEQGIFWQSVLSRTGQEADLVKPWPDMRDTPQAPGMGQVVLA